MSISLSDFQRQAPPQVNEGVFNWLAETFNGNRMGNSAIIGAVAANAGGKLVSVGGGFLNGMMNSDSSNFFGKVADGVKGAMEAYVIQTVLQSVPEQYRYMASAAVAVLGKMGGNMLSNEKENNDRLIMQQVSTNPMVEMMSVGGRENLLQAAQSSVKENYDNVSDPKLRQFYKMT